MGCSGRVTWAFHEVGSHHQSCSKAAEDHCLGEKETEAAASWWTHLAMACTGSRSFPGECCLVRTVCSRSEMDHCSSLAIAVVPSADTANVAIHVAHAGAAAGACAEAVDAALGDEEDTAVVLCFVDGDVVGAETADLDDYSQEVLQNVVPVAADNAGTVPGEEVGSEVVAAALPGEHCVLADVVLECREDLAHTAVPAVVVVVVVAFLLDGFVVLVDTVVLVAPQGEVVEVPYLQVCFRNDLAVVGPHTVETLEHTVAADSHFAASELANASPGSQGFLGAAVADLAEGFEYTLDAPRLGFGEEMPHLGSHSSHLSFVQDLVESAPSQSLADSAAVEEEQEFHAL